MRAPGRFEYLSDRSGLFSGATQALKENIVLLRSCRWRCVAYATSRRTLRRNLLIYGLGGIIVPFHGIWLIDQIVHWLHLA